MPGNVPRRKSRAARVGANPAAAVLMASLTVACGRENGAQIDPARLNEELARVMYLVKNAEGFDYQIQVVCRGSGGNALTFICHVDATTPGHPLNEWDETVTCQPVQDVDVPRCATASGYTLQ